MSTFKIENIINKQSLGSIERLYLIFCYRDDERADASFRCINKRLAKMNIGIRKTTCEKLISMFAQENYLGNTVNCKAYFENFFLKLK